MEYLCEKHTEGLLWVIPSQKLAVIHLFFLRLKYHDYPSQPLKLKTKGEKFFGKVLHWTKDLRNLLSSRFRSCYWIFIFLIFWKHWKFSDNVFTPKIGKSVAKLYEQSQNIWARENSFKNSSWIKVRVHMHCIKVNQIEKLTTLGTNEIITVCNLKVFSCLIAMWDCYYFLELDIREEKLEFGWSYSSGETSIASPSKDRRIMITLP